MPTTPLTADLVDLFDLADLLSLPIAWLEAEAEANRIPRLVVGPTDRRRKKPLYFFNPRAVADCLALRAALNDSIPTTGATK